MQLKTTKCYKIVDRQTSCVYCSGSCVRNGKTKGKQRFLCKTCKRTHLQQYNYAACAHRISCQIIQFLIEGNSIRSISRILKISATTVLRRILSIANNITRPPILFGKEYEVDELCTYVKKKTRLLWIAYAIRKDTREVVDFRVGRRTLNTLKHVTDTLLLSAPKKIHTDKLQLYKYLLPENIHSTKQRGTNYIERKNLSLRTHLRRLNRRTLCYSKKAVMLSACLKIYFWANTSFS